MTAQSPRDALSARLRLLPEPDDERYEPTNFFRRLLENQTPKLTVGATAEIQRTALFADHHRLQSRLSEALDAFHHHRACHSIEFCVVLALHGTSVARPYLADVGHWAYLLEQATLPESSAVDSVVHLRRGR